MASAPRVARARECDRVWRSVASVAECCRVWQVWRSAASIGV